MSLVASKGSQFLQPEVCSVFSYSYSYDLTHNLQRQMAPIINPSPFSSTANQSWQAWGPCNHFVKETTQDVSASTDLAEQLADRSEPRMLSDNRILDQAASHGDQVFPGDSSEVKNDNSSGDGQTQHSDVIIDSTEKKENENLNAVLSSNSYQNSASKSTNENREEQDRSTDDDTMLPAKETTGSEVQMLGSTSSEDTVQDSNTVGGEETCPDCKELRQQKERPFLNKSKSCGKFVWNRYLLQGFEGAVHPDWILHIVNGFVGQSGILLIVFTLQLILVTCAFFQEMVNVVYVNIHMSGIHA